MARKSTRRFYTSATIEPSGDVYAVLLDGRAAKTPAGAALAVPNQALARAIAEEWEGAGDPIDLDELPLTRLAATAIDLGARDRDRWAEEILNYLKSDLICYRAQEPQALIMRQEVIWSPYREWAKQALGADLPLASGLVAVEQPAEALAGARKRVSSMDDWSLLGLRTASGIAGSAVLGFALEARAFRPRDIFAASRLDERFQAERWGADDEATAREARLEREFMTVARWFELLAEKR